MTAKQKMFTNKRDKYIATLKDDIVTVRVSSFAAQGNSRICGVYDIGKHCWYNDTGRKVLPCSIKNQIERLFKPLDLEKV